MLAREREQPFGQHGPALRGFGGAIHELEGVAVIARLFLENVEITDDDSQQVVEVVRDAARQLADGLHLVGVPQLLLHDNAVRDLARVDHDRVHDRIVQEIADNRIDYAP